MVVSVIIPAHNEESVIGKTLQALPYNVEKIVVCNACTDKTADIAKNYAQVVKTPKKGVSYARNVGARIAKYDKLVFLDADIVIDGKTIPAIIRTNANIGTTKVKPNSNLLMDKFMMFIKSKIHRFGFNTGLIFCTKALFQKVEGFDESIAIHEDGKFLRSCKKIGNFKVLDTYVYNDMRRFRKRGYMGLTWYWIKETIFPTKKDYDTIR